MTTRVYIDYRMADIIELAHGARYNMGSDIGHFNLAICCHYIGDNLHAAGLKYGVDYWFDCSYIRPDGVRYIKYIFKDEGTAMFAKLKGITIDDY